MSNTLTRGKGRKNQPAELNNGNVTISQGQQPNGSLVGSAPQPKFGLPHVAMQGRAPENYAPQQNQYASNPIMNMTGAKVPVQSMPVPVTNMYQPSQQLGYQMNYPAPPPQYQQSYQGMQIYQFPNQNPYSPQQYYSSAQQYQNTAQNNMMQQQSAMPTQQIEQAVPVAPPKREKKILAIIDPTTQQKVDMEEQLKAKKAEMAASVSDESPASNERNANVRKEFAMNLRAQIERRESEMRKSESESHREPSVDPIPETQLPDVSTLTINDQPTQDSVKESTPLLEHDKESTRSSPETNDDTSAAVVETESILDPVDTIELVEPTKTEEVEKENSVEKNDDVDSSNIESPTQIEKTSTEIPSASTTSIVEETVHEVAEETEPEKTEEEKAAEEAEKKKLREIELDSLKDKLEEDLKEDIISMVYNRTFLNCVRDLEKEFKRTTCPLTDAQLKGFGIDRSSMPAGKEGKSKPDFNPSWVKQRNQGAKPYGGRSSFPADRGGHKQHPRKPTGPRPSIERQIERAVPLHKAEKAWTTAVKKTVELPEDEAKREAVLKSVRSLFNKITPTTQNALTEEFLKFDVSSNSETLSSVIDVIFDKAVEEPKFCPLYAQVCNVMVIVELKKDSVKSPFRDVILTRAQKTFVTKTQEEEREVKVKAIEAETDEKKQLQLKIELAEQDAKFRRRKFGNITFIGQLFCQRLLSERVINWCMYDLLKPTSDAPSPMPEEVEEAISCAVQLFETIGKSLEPKKGKDFDSFFTHLESLKEKVSNRIKFMILNLLELRKNNWLPRKVVEQGPKRIDQIHNDIKQEQILNQQARDKYERTQIRGGGGNMGPRDGGMKKTQIIGRNSSDNRRGLDKDRRAKAAASSNLASTTNLPPKTSLSKLDNASSSLGKKSNWRTGSAGGGGGNETVGPQPVKNAWGSRTSTGSREGSEQRKLSGAVNERQQAMAAAREMSHQSSGGPQRSDSQTSLASQSSQLNEEMSEKRIEEIQAGERKLMNAISSDIGEYTSGDVALEEISTGIFDFAGKERYGTLPLRNVFKALAMCAVEKMKPDHRVKAGHVLCRCLMDQDKREDALQGFAEYCSFAVDCEAWQDFPSVWMNLAEVIVNALQCDTNVFEGAHPPTFDDFKDSYLAASQDDRKAYQLAVLVLKLSSEICYKREPKDSETIISMTYEEIKCISTFDVPKWEKSLKEIPSPVPNYENLLHLLKGSA